MRVFGIASAWGMVLGVASFIDLYVGYQIAIQTDPSAFDCFAFGVMLACPAAFGIGFASALVVYGLKTLAEYVLNSTWQR